MTVYQDFTALKACGTEGARTQLLSTLQVNAMDETGSGLIHYAAVEGNITCLDSIMQRHDVDVNLAAPNGNTPLVEAAGSGRADAVVKLVDDGKASVDLPGREGFTPLMAAAQNGHAEAALRLLESGADANHANERGITALMAAALGGNERIVTRLLEANAVEASIRQQESDAPSRVDTYHLPASINQAMQIAAQNGNAAALELLLYEGANPNHADANGLTALMVAAAGGYAPIARTLIRWGARIEQPDNFGKTALEFAESAGHTGTAHLMRHESLDGDLRASPALRATLSCRATGELFSESVGAASPYLAASGHSFAKEIALEHRMNPVTREPWGEPPPMPNARMGGVMQALANAYDGTNLTESVRQAFVAATAPGQELGVDAAGRLERDRSFEIFVAKARIYLDEHGIRHPAVPPATLASSVAAEAASVAPVPSFRSFLSALPRASSSAGGGLASVSPVSAPVRSPSGPRL